MLNIHQKLCLALGLKEYMHHTLKQALTHHSYTEDNPVSQEGSRFVFLGQTAFKGVVAELLYENAVGTGMQLQNILGNLFKNDMLYQIHHYYSLHHYTRIGSKGNADKLKHIFVYALLGFMYDMADEDTLHDFISKHFILKGEHIFNKQQKSKDYRSQCIALYQTHKKVTPTAKHEKVKDNLHRVHIYAGDTIVGTAESKNYKYVFKKAWKNAMLALATERDQELIWDDNYIAMLIDKTKAERAIINKEKDEKLQAFYAKNAEHSEQMKSRKEAIKKEAQEKDRKRRDAKRRAKERKELQAKKDRYANLDLTAMSASKRRILEDRGILPKKK